MSGVRFPAGHRLECLAREHPRKQFRSGQKTVDSWLATKALQHQDKHLSATKVLLDGDGAIAGYYTLATGQIDFGDLPAEVAKGLPRRLLPVPVLAWLGVHRAEKEREARLALEQELQTLKGCLQRGKPPPGNGS